MDEPGDPLHGQRHLLGRLEDEGVPGRDGVGEEPKGDHAGEVERRSHREHAEWTPQRLLRWAEQIGPATAGVIQTLFERRAYPQHAFRAALGILRLAKGFGAERLEAASQRALRLGACSYKSLHSILKQGLDQQPPPEPSPPVPRVDHDNLRGPTYYH